MKKIALPMVLLFLVGFFTIFKKAQAQTDTVNATIRLSVCGDDVAENPESCDNSDLNSSTCRSLGYDVGTLVCDIACDFDTTGCSGVAPTPTPTPTPIPTPTPTPSTSESEATPTPTPTPTISRNIPIQPEIIVQPLDIYIPLPIQVLFFDPNKDGEIKKEEVYLVARNWVENWRQFSSGVKQESSECDINRDQNCDPVDFSILLYYIGQ